MCAQGCTLELLCLCVYVLRKREPSCTPTQGELSMHLGADDDPGHGCEHFEDSPFTSSIDQIRLKHNGVAAAAAPQQARNKHCRWAAVLRTAQR